VEFITNKSLNELVFKDGSSESRAAHLAAALSHLQVPRLTRPNVRVCTPQQLYFSKRRFSSIKTTFSKLFARATQLIRVIAWMIYYTMLHQRQTHYASAAGFFLSLCITIDQFCL
jgi:hypothetical protein